MKISIPRLPSFGYGRGILPKKPFIKGIDNYSLVGGIGIAGLIALYYAQQQGWITLPGLGGVITPEQEESADEGGSPTGHRISFVVSPVSQIENGTVLISGDIKDSNGVAYNAPNLYYYIYQELEGGLIKQVSSGNIGSNISTYRKVVSLAGLRAGDYKMRVSEEMLPSGGAIQSGSTEISGQTQPILDNIIPTTSGFVSGLG